MKSHEGSVSVLSNFAVYQQILHSTEAMVLLHSSVGKALDLYL